MCTQFFLTLRHFAILCLLALTSAATAQQNQKVIYPNLTGFSASTPQNLLATPDGGWLLSGWTRPSGPNTWFSQPQLLKLNPAGQTEWDQAYLTPTPPRGVTAQFGSIVDAPGGGWLGSLQNDSSGINIIRIAADGTGQWTKNIGEEVILMGTAGGFYYAYNYKWRNGGYVATLYKLNADGTIATSTVLPPVMVLTNAGNELVMTSDGQIQMLATEKTANILQSKLLRLDLNGTVLWSSAPFPYGEGRIAADLNGGLILYSSKKWTRYNAQGTVLNTSATNSLPDVRIIYSIRVTPDGGILIGGESITQRGVMAKLTADYSIAWIAESPEDGQSPVKNIVAALPTPDGWGIGLGPTVDNRFALLRISANTGLQIKTLTGRVARDANDNCAVETAEAGIKGAAVRAKAGTETFTAFSEADGTYTLKVPPGDYTLSADPVEQFFFTCPAANPVSVSLPASAPAVTSLNFPIQALALIHQIKGTLQIDENNNCTVESTDSPAHRWWVDVKGSGFNKTALTDANGQYSIWMPNGTYTVSADALNANFGFCAPASQNVTFNSTQGTVATVNFLANKKTNCALLKASAVNNRMRPCTSATLQILYSNSGTRSTDNTLITVELDPMLTYQSSSITPVSVQGQTLTFNVGTVAPSADYQSWSFTIEVMPSCSLQIGQQVCVSTSIHATGNCGNAPQWNGAIVTVWGKCLPGQGQSVFYIKNIGNAPNAQALEYIVAEDQIVLRSGTFQLAPQDSLPITVPSANPGSQTIVAQQEPGYPGDTIVSYTLTNCVGMGSGTGNTGNGFGGNAGPFLKQNCFEVRNSYDPNDKQAWPSGFGPKHIVSPGVPLEYTIRFQNTGNDTAFLVVLRDTLSDMLAARTLEPLSSSHAYRVDLFDNRILQFTFDNIRLPDSTTNPAASQGYVRFKVRPRSNLPLGTAIHNRAAIYFDYNLPIITNIVTRTIDRYFEVSSTQIPGFSMPVSVSPNPVLQTAWLRLPDDFDTDTELTFMLTNSVGQLLQTAVFTGRQYEMQCADLPEGVYFWQIMEANRRIAAGKVIRQ